MFTTFLAGLTAAFAGAKVVGGIASPALSFVTTNWTWLAPAGFGIVAVIEVASGDWLTGIKTGLAGVGLYAINSKLKAL